MNKTKQLKKELTLWMTTWKHQPPNTNKPKVELPKWMKGENK